MQCYALTRAIQKRYGNIVEVIDFEKKSKHEMYQWGIKKFIQHGFDYRTTYKRFQDDLCLLPLSPEKIISDNYEDVYNYINDRYDLVIVGSDAVWAYHRHLGLRNPYWLGPEIKCRKMSYAASAYSLDVKKVSQEEKHYINQCLEGYDYIGVRDDETLRFVKGINSELNVHRNCDPTALLPQPNNDYAKSILSRCGVDLSKPVVSFMISGTPYVDSIMKELGDKYEYIMLLSRNRIHDRFTKRKEKFLPQLSPLEWHTIFSACYLNITKYFHGTMLALKSDVPTLAFDVTDINYEYVSKIRQILTDLDLSEYWISLLNCTRHEVICKLHELIDRHDEISQCINMRMKTEKGKSESFFQALDKVVTSV